MPTILTHAALPLIAAWGLGSARVPRRLAFAGALLAVAPDFDVVGRLLDVPHDAILGHRGISHCLLFALAMALLAMPLMGRCRPAWTFAFLFAAGASHGLADMLTQGSKGIMLWWPLSEVRYDWAEQPIPASGVLARSITDGSLPYILWAELCWLLVPLLIVAAIVRWLLPPDIDLAKGQT